jgi:cell division protein ZapA
MCALQFASQLEQKQISNSIDGKETIERIKKINNLLISYLDPRGTTGLAEGN